MTPEDKCMISSDKLQALIAKIEAVTSQSERTNALIHEPEGLSQTVNHHKYVLSDLQGKIQVLELKTQALESAKSTLENTLGVAVTQLQEIKELQKWAMRLVFTTLIGVIVTGALAISNKVSLLSPDPAAPVKQRP
jgi:chromosome segregation ATPase